VSSLYDNTLCNTLAAGRAMAQAVSRRPPTAEARFQSRVSPCGICGGQSGTGTVFPEYFGFPLSISFHRCSITRKRAKIIIIIVIFIIGLHNKPQGCGASVASAAGPFTTKKKIHWQPVKGESTYTSTPSTDCSHMLDTDILV
jgi:hypothetical protein